MGCWGLEQSLKCFGQGHIVRCLNKGGKDPKRNPKKSRDFCFVLFVLDSLFVFERQYDRGRPICEPTAGSLPKYTDQQGLNQARPKPIAWNLVWISHEGGKPSPVCLSRWLELEVEPRFKWGPSG